MFLHSALVICKATALSGAQQAVVSVHVEDVCTHSIA